LHGANAHVGLVAIASESLDLGLDARLDHVGGLAAPFGHDLCQVALVTGDLELPVLRRVERAQRIQVLVADRLAQARILRLDCKPRLPLLIRHVGNLH
jgi:hypothetical protein